MKNKKGIALNDAPVAILSLVLIAVLIIVALILFTNINVGLQNAIRGVVITNESLTMKGPLNASVSNSTNCQFNDFSVIAVNNGTLSANSGNYSYDSYGNIINKTGSIAGTWKVTYQYDWGGQACVASDNTSYQFTSYPTLIGLIGTVIFLGIVIGVLVASFAFGNKSP